MISLAAIEATLAGPVPPVLTALRTDPDTLRERTDALAARLDHVGEADNALVEQMMQGFYRSAAVVLRINDRGPFVRGRIIDVSRAAAVRLDMLRAGVVPVRVETLD